MSKVTSIDPPRVGATPRRVQVGEELNSSGHLALQASAVVQRWVFVLRRRCPAAVDTLIGDRVRALSVEDEEDRRMSPIKLLWTSPSPHPPEFVYNTMNLPSTAPSPDQASKEPPRFEFVFPIGQGILTTAFTWRPNPPDSDSRPSEYLNADMESEDPPSNPYQFSGRLAWYGFEFTDADMIKYDENRLEFTDADKIDSDCTPHPDLFSRKQEVVEEHALAAGMCFRTRIANASLRNKKDDHACKNDFVYFMSSNMRHCPTKAKIDQLRAALGVESEAKWLTV